MSLLYTFNGCASYTTMGTQFFQWGNDNLSKLNIHVAYAYSTYVLSEVTNR